MLRLTSGRVSLHILAPFLALDCYYSQLVSLGVGGEPRRVMFLLFWLSLCLKQVLCPWIWAEGVTSLSCTSGLNTYSCPSPREKEVYTLFPAPTPSFTGERPSALRPRVCVALSSAVSSTVQMGKVREGHFLRILASLFVNTGQVPWRGACKCLWISLMSVAPGYTLPLPILAEFFLRGSNWVCAY